MAEKHVQIGLPEATGEAMTLPSSLVSAALNRDINSKANRFGRATQGLIKIFTAFCMSLFLWAAVDKAEGGDRANEGVSLGPGTIQLAQATVAQGALSDKPEPACEGCRSEVLRPLADATRPGRRNGSV